MLTLLATLYASAATAAYQRLTVMATDAVDFVGARQLMQAEGGGRSGGPPVWCAVPLVAGRLLLITTSSTTRMMVELLLFLAAKLRAGHAVCGGMLNAVLLIVELCDIVLGVKLADFGMCVWGG